MQSLLYDASVLHIRLWLKSIASMNIFNYCRERLSLVGSAEDCVLRVLRDEVQGLNEK
jgi:hypothetical protein